MYVILDASGVCVLCVCKMDLECFKTTACGDMDAFIPVGLGNTQD